MTQEKILEQKAEANVHDKIRNIVAKGIQNEINKPLPLYPEEKIHDNKIQPGKISNEVIKYIKKESEGIIKSGPSLESQLFVKTQTEKDLTSAIKTVKSELSEITDNGDLSTVQKEKIVYSTFESLKNKLHLNENYLWLTESERKDVNEINHKLDVMAIHIYNILDDHNLSDIEKQKEIDKELASLNKYLGVNEEEKSAMNTGGIVAKKKMG
ncbi:MAG: hypothetical protein NTY68_05185 [Candidatus Micrarchaeota archaeon]|nr:hypothetical protein [Candidatus Micrarchaeota archaeon]